MKPWSIVCLMIVLGGCDRGVYSDWSRERTAETADIARVDSANSLSRVSELEGRIQKLEQRIDELETEKDLNKANISILFDKAGPAVNAWQDKQIDTLYENDRKIAARLNLPAN